MDAFLEALPVINSVDIISRVETFLTEAQLEMTAFRGYFQALNTEPLPWLLLLITLFWGYTSRHDRAYQMMICLAVICTGHSTGEL